MTPLDWILSFVGLGGFILFVGIIASFVPETDLIVVIAAAVGLAAYDFWVRPLRGRKR
ncbi:MAG: hypothetical protein AAGB11_15620 [Pseudomonadota bacterium]